MSMWEFTAALDGYNQLHGQHKIEPPTEEEFEAMVEKTGGRTITSDAVH